MHLILEEDMNEKKGALWLGDYTAALDKDMLKSKGINTVLTTAQGLTIYYPQSSKIIHRQWFMLDHPSFNISRYFQDVIIEIEEGLRRGGVLVHCAAGVSRSASCVIAYIMQKKQMTYPTAFNFVKKKRRVISPNPGFLKQLQQFDKQLSSNSSKRRISMSRINTNTGQTSAVGFSYVDPSFSDEAYNNYQTSFNMNNTVGKNTNPVKQSDVNKRDENNKTTAIKEEEKRLHNLTKQIADIPINKPLNPRNSIQKSVDDKYLKNSMEILKSKSHKYLIKKTEAKGTIRLNRNNSLEASQFINVSNKLEQTEQKYNPQSTKSNSPQSIFDMLYIQQQLKKKFQARPQKTMTVLAQVQPQKQQMFISQAQKNLRKTFSYLNNQKENLI
ncbi:dual specificity phosphatase domain protein (macronuclear) [Tetrahymena thermophila SB210]|uniref:protein-tyrosine-phosphatase n=1 Tax=Tetrahymena thermophila (strain SB210) TaxID=312017 RepID=I7MDY4_TETTS|nr:dual specificity phosphatase domain protein [Tetrahymena thermophila SB210]EAR92950.2 dual specificity phosphatase domain protein [Tetrahymena thermophila SB210]|eukprot:XP_001013195.2 dual specificity phosphatase domain protein [Tetrahymena thermophila SB210]